MIKHRRGFFVNTRVAEGLLRDVVFPPICILLLDCIKVYWSGSKKSKPTQYIARAGEQRIAAPLQLFSEKKKLIK